jgi:pilus assembly protein CpaF
MFGKRQQGSNPGAAAGAPQQGMAQPGTPQQPAPQPAAPQMAPVQPDQAIPAGGQQPVMQPQAPAGESMSAMQPGTMAQPGMTGMPQPGMPGAMPGNGGMAQPQMPGMMHSPTGGAAPAAGPAGMAAPQAPAAQPAAASSPKPNLPPGIAKERTEEYYNIKSMIFNALIDAIDLTQLSQLDPESARDEIRDIVNEIIAIKDVALSIAEQEELLEDICNDVLGYGPLEPLLARDDIADIMVNGAEKVFIEVNGKVVEAGIRFRDNTQLLNICQRIVSQVGRRVDESSPICDARLPDGSRVNVIVPPLAIDGPALTIRKFKKDRLTLEDLVRLGTITPEGAEILKIIGRVRCNVLISGGTGSGKTTLLNCLTAYIDEDERIITCEDAAELQLQQSHVVRLETRPPNLEGEGEITMRDLVRNCLRMRPERIIVGEVRGPEAFDLLQAMNTGHDGSMGTLHANSPREALSRLESMITMGGFQLPSKTIREMIVGSVDVIIQAARLRDGSRKITHITEVTGMEGDVIITQDLFVYEILGEDENGKVLGRHRSTGIARPAFWDRARYYGEEKRLLEALERAEMRDAAQPEAEF